jgi:hypothetical protein
VADDDRERGSEFRQEYMHLGTHRVRKDKTSQIQISVAPSIVNPSAPQLLVAPISLYAHIEPFLWRRSYLGMFPNMFEAGEYRGSSSADRPTIRRFRAS